MNLISESRVGFFSMFDQDLQDFQLVGVEPDFVTSKTFIYRNHILVIVGSGQHPRSTVGAGDLR